jgi:Kelch motif protein
MLGDTWEWDGMAWTERGVAGPDPREGAAMAALGGKLVLFGGLGKSALYNDTWLWDGTAWTELMVPGPPARFSHAMATVCDGILLFGGYNGKILGDTWAWDGAAWTTVDVSGPSARLGPAISSFGDGALLFGGTGLERYPDGGSPPPTWQWRSAESAWTVSPESLTTPGPRDEASMACSPR